MCGKRNCEKTVAQSHRNAGFLLVGYFMKSKRERQLAARGLLPLVPNSAHRITFVPLDLELPLETQGPFDIVLHKVPFRIYRQYY